ncbi:MAG: HlyD family type I secretion periplasmic adaptor subunit [Alphaproteobacteria bacterium]|nr:HlyD family type I secretion periplasmic adaptor subunit [Alphaproteobacteria bacterium]
MSNLEHKTVPGRNRSELEFLPAALEVLDTPPRPAARMTALLIATFFTFALIWSIFGQIDTVAVTDGMLVTRERVKLVQPLENSVIRSLPVRDGQQVKKGDILVELDPTETSANVEALRYDLLKARLDAASAAAILSDKPSQTFMSPADAEPTVTKVTLAQMMGELEKHRAEIKTLEAQMNEQRGEIEVQRLEEEKFRDVFPILERRHAALEKLFGKELVAEPVYMEAVQQLIEARSNIASNKASQAQAAAKLDALERRREETRASFRATHLQHHAEALSKIASLEQQVRKETRRDAQRTLRAPIDGTVFGLSVFTVGGVVTTKDTLMRIVPKGSPLEAEVTVMNKDIGFVSEGQKTEVKLETFPFTRYGLIDGRVKHIWRDAIPDEKRGLIYKAIVELDATKILVGSRWVPLAPGMSVQAEIKTGHRSVISFFLSPLLRYRDESMRER